MAYLWLNFVAIEWWQSNLVAIQMKWLNLIVNNHGLITLFGCQPPRSCDQIQSQPFDSDWILFTPIWWWLKFWLKLENIWVLLKKIGFIFGFLFAHLGFVFLVAHLQPLQAPQIYKLHRFISNSHGISCFIGLCCLHMDFIPINTYDACIYIMEYFHVNQNISLCFYTCIIHVLKAWNPCAKNMNSWNN